MMASSPCPRCGGTGVVNPDPLEPRIQRACPVCSASSPALARVLQQGQADELRRLIGRHATDWAKHKDTYDATELVTFVELDAYIDSLTIESSAPKRGLYPPMLIGPASSGDGWSAEDEAPIDLVPTLPSSSDGCENCRGPKAGGHHLCAKCGGR